MKARFFYVNKQLSEKQIGKHAQNNTDDDAGNNRKVKGAIFSHYIYISRQLPEGNDFTPEVNNTAHNHQNYS